jgi:hypothetical protein
VKPDTCSHSTRPSEFSSKLLHPRGRPHTTLRRDAEFWDRPIELVGIKGTQVPSCRHLSGRGDAQLRDSMTMMPVSLGRRNIYPAYTRLPLRCGRRGWHRRNRNQAWRVRSGAYDLAPTYELWSVRVSVGCRRCRTRSSLLETGRRSRSAAGYFREVPIPVPSSVGGLEVAGWQTFSSRAGL